MERQRACERFAIHREPYCQCDLHADLHRPRRQRGAINDGHRQASGAHGHAERKSKRREEKWKCNTDLVINQRNLVCRLRCLVGCCGIERLAVNRCAEEHFHLHCDLHWLRRKRGTVRDRYRQRESFRDGELRRKPKYD
jgi:hypothetical protein